MDNNRKVRVVLIFGGKSAEHEVSIQSAKNVYGAMDLGKFEVMLIAIDKKGRWYLVEDKIFKSLGDTPEPVEIEESGQELAIIPGKGGAHFISISMNKPLEAIDVAFPILHGPFGEDGTVQGLLKLLDIPFVGADVLGSAVGMDKCVMKKLLRDAGVPNADFLEFRNNNQNEISYEVVSQKLGSPVFIKPANQGSSVGISMVNDEKAFYESVKFAFKYDNKILVEEYVNGREIECSVLGNSSPRASLPGEIRPKSGFYSYEAKYLDDNGAELLIPADLPENTIKKVKELAVEVFKVLCCEGMARVDFFLNKEGDLVVNEINTIPGFTTISMYPKLWGESGIGYKELIEELIRLAIDR